MRYYLLDQIDCWLEVQTEVYERPLYAFALIFLLFEDEHVVIEKLLQTLVGMVYTELIETIVLYRAEDRSMERMVVNRSKKRHK